MPEGYKKPLFLSQEEPQNLLIGYQEHGSEDRVLAPISTSSIAGRNAEIAIDKIDTKSRTS
jgi:hypothetical protein